MKAKEKVIIGLILIPLIALSVVTQLYILLPVNDVVLALFNKATLQNIGNLTSLFGLFYAFGLLFWGVISDKTKKEHVLMLGLFILSIITYVLPIIKEYNHILIVRCLQGFFAASFPPVAISWLTENLGDSLKTKAISFISCAFLLAGTIGQWYGSITIEESLHKAMWLLASIYCLGAALFFFLSKRNDVYPKKSIKKEYINTKKTNVFIDILFDKKLFKIYFCSLLTLLSFMALYTKLNMSNLSIDVIFLRKIGVLAMLFSLTTSYVFKFLKPQVLLFIATLLMSITLSLHAFYLDELIQSKIYLPIIHFLFILGLSYAVPSMITNISILAQNETRGISTSLYTFILFIGASLGSYLSLKLYSNSLLYIISIMLFLASILLIYNNKNSKGK